MKRAVVFAILTLSACATPHAHQRCFVRDEDVARGIAPAIMALPADSPQLQLQDAGDHWLAFRTPDVRMENDRIVTDNGGYSLEIEKCSGAISNERMH